MACPGNGGEKGNEEWIVEDVLGPLSEVLPERKESPAKFEVAEKIGALVNRNAGGENGSA